MLPKKMVGILQPNWFEITMKVNDIYPELKDASLWNLEWASWIHDAIKDLKRFEGELSNSARLNKIKFEISRKRAN